MNPTLLHIHDSLVPLVKAMEILHELPPKPKPPLASDCCGNGCKLCVFDIYEKEISVWNEECQRILDGKYSECHQKPNNQIVISCDRYTKFELREIIPSTKSTTIYRFQLRNGTSLNLQPGQHLMLRIVVDEETFTRPYTPIIRTDEDFFDILIKVYEHGRVTPYIKKKWKVGDLVDWRGPLGDFTYRPNMHKHLCLFAAGTGIAPMLQIIQVVLDNEDDDTFINLHFSCQSYDDILLKSRLDTFNEYWNFKVKYILSKELNHEKMRYGDIIYHGHVKQKYLEENVPVIDNVYFLICGTTSYVQDITRYLLQLSVQHENIYCF